MGAEVGGSGAGSPMSARPVSAISATSWSGVGASGAAFAVQSDAIVASCGMGV